eukprot:scaffold26652_cov151-Skeletonema_menzelii.AAC.7
MLYILGRCLDPRNLRRSGVTTIADCCCFDLDDIVVGEGFNVDLEEEEFVRLLPSPPTEEPRRDNDGDAISLSPRRCREVLRLRLFNLLINDGIIDLAEIVGKQFPSSAYHRRQASLYWNCAARFLLDSLHQWAVPKALTAMGARYHYRHDDVDLAFDAGVNLASGVFSHAGSAFQPFPLFCTPAFHRFHVPTHLEVDGAISINKSAFGFTVSYSNPTLTVQIKSLPLPPSLLSCSFVKVLHSYSSLGAKIHCSTHRRAAI